MIRITVALTLLLAGCAGAPEGRTYYLLRADTPKLAPANPDASVGMGSVRVAPYLDRALSDALAD